MKIIFPIRSQYTKTYLIIDHVFTDTDGTFNKYVSLNERKTSVDGGGFTPGVYRVTPYENMGGKITGKNLSFSSSYLQPYSGSFMLHEATVSGKLLAQAVETAQVQYPTPNTDSYEQLALQKAKSNVMNADLALGETIGEYRETIKMLRNPLKELRTFLVSDRMRNWRLLKALASKDKRQVHRLLGRTGLASAKTMTNTWLELRYGFRPLVGLVQDVIEKVNDVRRGVYDPDKIRSSKSSYLFTETHKVDKGYPLGSIYIRGPVTVEDKIKVNASIQYRQDRDQSFLDQLGLTPRFLPEVAWELTRLSFVVDWLFDIGAWLGSLRCSPGVEILGNTVGVLINRTVTAEGFAGRYNYYKVPWKPVGGSMKLETFQYIRRCHVDMELLPHFTWGRTLDLYKAVDAVSLIWQIAENLLLKRGKKGR
jgi:hypothetical protein